MLSSSKMWAGQSADFDEIPPESTSGSDKSGFRSAWTSVFNGSSKECLANIRKLAFAGEISDLPFRSVIWKLLLALLPPNPKTWMHESSIQRSRYERMKEKYLTEVYEKSSEKASAMRNGGNGTGAYSDEDLRRDIRQDVVRTFPEMDFFADPKVVGMMCTILFIYAKENSDVLYKQGMHELLAIIFYVLDKDHTAFKKCVKSKTKMSDRVHAVLRSSHIEHDAFILFSKVMQHTKVWYEYRDSTFQQFKSRFAFSNSQNSELELQSPAIKKINTIWSKSVRSMDPELHYKLTCLDIQPHFFSLRWLRLIFARELHFNEVLNLWDAIFAYDSDLSFIDSVYCAILYSIRNELISGDHSSCLQTLMRHPKNLTTFRLVSWAMYIADPNNNSKPLDFVDRSGWEHPDKPAAKKTVPLKTVRSYSLTNLLSAVMGSGGSKEPETPRKAEKPMDLSRIIENRPNKQRSPRKFSYTSTATASNQLLTYQQASSTSTTPRYSANSSRSTNSSQTPREDLANKCNYCSQRIETFIQSLYEVLQDEELKNDEKILVSIAGLKQVRDVLNGSIKVPSSKLEESSEASGVPELSSQYPSTSSNSSSTKNNSEMVELYVSGENNNSPVTPDQKVVLNGAVIHSSKTKEESDCSNIESPFVKSSPETMVTVRKNPPKARNFKALNGASKKLLLPDKSLTASFSPTILTESKPISSSTLTDPVVVSEHDPSVVKSESGTTDDVTFISSPEGPISLGSVSDSIARVPKLLMSCEGFTDESTPSNDNEVD